MIVEASVVRKKRDQVASRDRNTCQSSVWVRGTGPRSSAVKSTASCVVVRGGKGIAFSWGGRPAFLGGGGVDAGGVDGVTGSTEVTAVRVMGSPVCRAFWRS